MDIMDDFKNKLRKYINEYQSSPWGGCIVYISLLMAVFLGLWGLIEPLSIPDEIPVLNKDYFIIRSTAHILVSILIAAHVSLIIPIIGKFFVRESPNNFPQENIGNLKNVAEINKLQTEINSITSEYLIKTNQEINSQITNIFTEKSNLEKRIEELETLIENYRLSSNIMSKQLEEAIEERSRLMKKINILEKKFEEISKENNILKGEIQTYGQDQDSLTYPYDTSFRIPTPIISLTIRSPFVNKPASINVKMKLDISADVSALPKKQIEKLETEFDIQLPYTAMVVNSASGRKITMKAYNLNIQPFNEKIIDQPFVTSFLPINSEFGILGRDFLNHFNICFDGPNLVFKIFSKSKS